MTANANRRVDIYQTITDQIIAAVDTGTGPVEMPWHRSGSGITQPVNVESGKPYRGINTVALWAAAITGSFSNGFWGTYRQWQERGAQVRKGEKSSLIVLYKELEVADGDADEGKIRRFITKASRVFNAAQVDGYTAPELDQTTDPIDPIVAADRFIRATGAVITEGGESAFYHRAHDTITMPDRFRFKDTTTSTATESWYAVLLHELTHWSGATPRLDRQFGNRFGDDAYAMEELVAELGAAFLCGDLRITAEPRPDHAAYIAHWLQIMKADRKAIFAAASAASKAREFLADLQMQGNIGAD